MNPGSVWTNGSIQFWGNKDFFVQRSPQNYTINDFNNKTGFGATASVAYVKYPEGYGVAWTVQANYLWNSYTYLQNNTFPGYNNTDEEVEYYDVYLALWFSPDWDINNGTINFYCTQNIYPVSWANETNSTLVVNNEW